MKGELAAADARAQMLTEAMEQDIDLHSQVA